MTIRLGFCAAFLSLAGLASNLPVTELTGNYVEARTADVYTGACYANSEVQLVGNLAVLGWQIDKGQWKGVNLDGLKVAAAIRAKSTLGDLTGDSYPVQSVLFVDSRANIEQRDALRQFARQMTGDLLEDIVRVEAAPIEFTIAGGSIHEARVSLTAGTLARIRTRAINPGDHVCHHEIAWYPPLSKTAHAMPAYTEDSGYRGAALASTWSSPDKRSAYVGTFSYRE